jgi:hypothetical protein
LQVQPPLPKPDHLETATRRAAGIAALVIGIVAFVVAAVARDHIFETTDWRIGIPGFVLTALAGGASVLRGERAYALVLGGLGLAGAGLLLGWFLMLTILLGVTALVVGILHHVL